MSGQDYYDILCERGFYKQCTDKEGVKKLLSDGNVLAYIGFDPTASSLHAGSLVQIMTLLNLQRAGHKPIALVGGGTGLIGDPSGKTEQRQLLTKETLRTNFEGIKSQIQRFLGTDESSAIYVDNSDWLEGLNYIEFLRDIGRHFSVNRMLSFEAYKIRMEKGLSFLEFNYQLLQAYDFLVLYQKYGCRLQLGGDDQWGNIVAGIDLVRRVESIEAFGLTTPLLATAGGAKMGKTASGAVWLDAQRYSPYDYYQYWINTDDRDVGRFLGLFTLLPMDEVRRLSALQGAEIREAKQLLAYEATALCHGKEEADKAKAGALAAFSGGGDKDSMPTSEISKAKFAEGMRATELYAEVGLCSSKGEAARLIKGGGAVVGDRKLQSHADTVSLDDFNGEDLILRAGKKKKHRVILSDQ